MSAFETSKYAGDPATVAAIKHTLESLGAIFPDEAGENSTVTLRRFQVGDVVRFRAQSRVRGSYDIAEDELGTVVWVEPHPPETGPTYKIEVHLERARVPRIFKFEYELVKAAPSGHVPTENVLVVTPHVSNDDVDAFCSFCVSLRSTFRHYQILFEEGADLRRELLHGIAPTFFPDLNEMLNEHPQGVFYLNGVGQLSDADSLVKALKESTYFHALLNDEKLTQKCADVAFGSKFSEA